VLRVAFRLILIFILAFTGVKIWYNRLEREMLASVPAEKVVQAGPVEKKVEIRRKPDDYRIIIDRNIFGAALEKNAEDNESAPAEELQPTKLKLSLMGTVSGTAEDSRAIILDDTTRKQDIYSVGNTVQGAQIRSIERRKVVLRVNGRDEVLNIKDRETGPAESTVSSASSPVGGRTLQDRLTVRRPAVRPSFPNRPRPVVRTPAAVGEHEEDNGNLTEEEGGQLPDFDTEQPDEIDTSDQDQPEEPDFMDNEPPPDEPGTKDEEPY